MFNILPLDGLYSDKNDQVRRCCFVCLDLSHLVAKITDFGWVNLFNKNIGSIPAKPRFTMFFDENLSTDSTLLYLVVKSMRTFEDIFSG